jgi:ABC-type ATPase involved in cell division
MTISIARQWDEDISAEQSGVLQYGEYSQKYHEQAMEMQADSKQRVKIAKRIVAEREIVAR